MRMCRSRSVSLSAAKFSIYRGAALAILKNAGASEAQIWDAHRIFDRIGKKDFMAFLDITVALAPHLPLSEDLLEKAKNEEDE